MIWGYHYSWKHPYIMDFVKAAKPLMFVYVRKQPTKKKKGFLNIQSASFHRLYFYFLGLHKKKSQHRHIVRYVGTDILVWCLCVIKRPAFQRKTCFFPPYLFSLKNMKKYITYRKKNMRWSFFLPNLRMIQSQVSQPAFKRPAPRDFVP